MGYICNPSENMDVIEYNAWLGQGKLAPYSVGIWVYGTNRFYLYDESVSDWNGKPLDCKANKKFKEGDRFQMLYDFNTMKCCIYCNGISMDLIPIKSKSIIPGLSLGWTDEAVQITEWKLICIE